MRGKHRPEGETDEGDAQHSHEAPDGQEEAKDSTDNETDDDAQCVSQEQLLTQAVMTMNVPSFSRTIGFTPRSISEVNVAMFSTASGVP